MPGTPEHRGRGRPRDASKDDTIRTASWRVLADKGYDGLTFEAVAEAAGCSRATLYRRFASKSELIMALLYETARSVEPDIADEAAPRDILFAHASAAATYLAGERGQAIMSLGVASRQSPELAAALASNGDAEMRFYLREFARLRPDARAEDVAFAARTLVGAIVYHVAMLHEALPPRRIRQLVDHAVALFEASVEEGA